MVSVLGVGDQVPSEPLGDTGKKGGGIGSDAERDGLAEDDRPVAQRRQVQREQAEEDLPEQRWVFAILRSRRSDGEERYGERVEGMGGKRGGERFIDGRPNRRERSHRAYQLYLTHLKEGA